jgi:hypothetical protein
VQRDSSLDSGLGRVTPADLLVAYFLALVVGALAISSQSLWLDEGGTAYKAIQPSIQAWWEALWWERNTNLQLPLYLLTIWAWTKAFGVSELALRAINIPVLLICVCGLYYLFRLQRRRFIWSVTFLLSSPFVWYYLNEARPYLFRLAPSIFLFAAFKRLLESHHDDNRAQIAFRVFAISAFFVSASSPLATIWVFCSFLAIWWRFGTGSMRNFLLSSALTSFLAIAGLGAVGLYNLYVWQRGVGVTRFGHNLGTALPYAVYELFGFSGMGPSRLALREDIRALIPFALPLAIFVLGWALVLFTARKKQSRGKSESHLHPLLVLSYLVCPIIAVLIIGWAQHARILPRYFTPVFAMIVWLSAVALERASARGRWGQATVVLFLGLNLISSMQQRFASRHVKENYRLAVHIAKSTATPDAKVFWGADSQTALYYGLFENREPSEGDTVIRQRNHLSECSSVILSRPDVFDADGSVQRYVANRGFTEVARLQGFRVFARSRQP